MLGTARYPRLDLVLPAQAPAASRGFGTGEETQGRKHTSNGARRAGVALPKILQADRLQGHPVPAHGAAAGDRIGYVAWSSKQDETAIDFSARRLPTQASRKARLRKMKEAKGSALDQVELRESRDIGSLLRQLHLLRDGANSRRRAGEPPPSTVRAPNAPEERPVLPSPKKATSHSHSYRPRHTSEERPTSVFGMLPLLMARWNSFLEAQEVLITRPVDEVR
eukprot:TRINITY_DN68242_c0_g1_i1.p1 TRINITY_DN68242_c0_g1~~TRINITY_DN68242_c0_g1_i1.p1  ORF type:complete len:235 (+),score=30.05 TRINITY_DN68242_c0_g1_i1:37-705(+)